MSCETLVCMGSQTVNRHKPRMYPCPPQGASYPCPPQGTNQSRPWPSTYPCSRKQGSYNYMTHSSLNNSCPGSRQATARTLPKYAGCLIQSTTRSKPKVNVSFDNMSNRESLKQYTIKVSFMIFHVCMCVKNSKIHLFKL